jgi:chromosome segregation ATPase
MAGAEPSDMTVAEVLEHVRDLEQQIELSSARERQLGERLADAQAEFKRVSTVLTLERSKHESTRRHAQQREDQLREHIADGVDQLAALAAERDAERARRYDEVELRERVVDDVRSELNVERARVQTLEKQREALGRVMQNAQRREQQLKQHLADAVGQLAALTAERDAERARRHDEVDLREQALDDMRSELNAERASVKTLEDQQRKTSDKFVRDAVPALRAGATICRLWAEEMDGWLQERFLKKAHLFDLIAARAPIDVVSPPVTTNPTVAGGS